MIDVGAIENPALRETVSLIVEDIEVLANMDPSLEKTHFAYQILSRIDDLGFQNYELISQLIDLHQKAVLRFKKAA